MLEKTGYSIIRKDGKITIPHTIRKEYNIKDGDLIEFNITKVYHEM